MAKIKAAAKGHSSYTTVAVTVEAYRRKSKTRSSYYGTKQRRKPYKHR